MVKSSAQAATHWETVRTLTLQSTEVARHAELWPWLLAAFLPLALADLLIRRWEHVRGLFAPLRLARPHA